MSMLTAFSLWMRKNKLRKQEKSVLSTFCDWEKALPPEPAHQTHLKKTLLVRLDDIGDYILFRNTLTEYRAAEKGASLYLLANAAWKQLFETFDKGSVDVVIWVDKGRYFSDTSYRMDLLTRLRAECFSKVIVTSLSRSLLLDDILVLASAAKERIAPRNNTPLKSWNIRSDSCYSQLIEARKRQYEFISNIDIFNAVYQEKLHLDYPVLPPVSTAHVTDEKYIAFFIGANIKSRRWPNSRWAALLQQLASEKPGHHQVLLGGPGDARNADEITSAVQHDITNLAGRCSLLETIGYIQKATLLVSNNTMAYHVSMAYRKPTVIITSGDNHYRFTHFPADMFEDVSVIYPDRFLKAWKKNDYSSFDGFVAVKSDIASITPDRVLKEIHSVWPDN